MSPKGSGGALSLVAVMFLIVGIVVGMVWQVEFPLLHLASQKPTLQQAMHEHDWHNDRKGIVQYRLLGDAGPCPIYEATIRGQDYIVTQGCGIMPRIPHE